MQNTTTLAARNIVRKICAENNITIGRTWTNECRAYDTLGADCSKLRNLCFMCSNISESVLQQIAAALNVKRVHTTKADATFAYNAHYLRIVHCSI